MKKILITGVSGMLGNNLARFFRDRFYVAGWHYQNKVNFPGVAISGVNLLDKEALAKALDIAKPDVVLHCAGLTHLDFCEKNRGTGFAMNVEATQNLVSALSKSSVKLVYISSDAVYDGEKGNYTEKDDTHPINYYGWTKREAEKIVLPFENGLVLRTNIFGWNILPKLNLGEWIVSSLKKGEKIKGFNDTFFSALYTFSFAEVLEKCLAKNLSGLYICASKTTLSKFQFATELARFLKLNSSLIEPSSIDDFPFAAKRGKNLSLCPNKMEEDLSESLPTLEESVESFVRDFEKGLPVKIKQENAASVS